MMYLTLPLAGLVSASPALAPRDGSSTRRTGQGQGASRRKDIVVTGCIFIVADGSAATKSDAAILSMPQAIPVIDSAFINILNVPAVAEALNHISGVRFQASGSDTRINCRQLRSLANAIFFKDGLVFYNSGAFPSQATPAGAREWREVPRTALGPLR